MKRENKDIQWAVHEICKAYGHAPREGSAELYDILGEYREHLFAQITNPPQQGQAE